MDGTVAHYRSGSAANRFGNHGMTVDGCAAHGNEEIFRSGKSRVADHPLHGVIDGAGDNGINEMRTEFSDRPHSSEDSTTFRLDLYVSVYDFLRLRLQHPLPGIDAHRELLPPLPGNEQRLRTPPDDARKSAVLVPLLPVAEDLSVLFTVRSQHVGSHQGQISFPGGRIEDGESYQQAALRELEEETGVVAAGVQVLGQLSPIYIPPSHSLVVPVVGMIEPPRQYQPSAREVTEIFDIPLSTFLDSSTLRLAPRSMGDLTIKVPQWHVHPTVPLWGATAMILNELLWLVREFQDSSER